MSRFAPEVCEALLEKIVEFFNGMPSLYVVALARHLTALPKEARRAA